MERSSLKRRKDDEKHRSMLWNGAKATVAFLFFGTLSFVGSWAYGLNKAVADLGEKYFVVHDRVEMMLPVMYDDIKSMRNDNREIQREIKELAIEIRSQKRK